MMPRLSYGRVQWPYNTSLAMAIWQMHMVKMRSTKPCGPQLKMVSGSDLSAVRSLLPANAGGGDGGGGLSEMQALHEIMEAEAEQLQHNKSRAAWEQICRLAGCNASAGAASVSDNVTRYLDERLAVMQRLEVAAEKKLRECQTADEGLADRARAEEEFYRAGGSPMEWFGKCGTEEVFVHLLTHTHAHTQKCDMHEQI